MLASPILEATNVLHLHDRTVERWHQPALSPDERPATDLIGLVLRQHRANFDLWHQEDRARDPDAPDARIAAVKRAIDRLNQQRNDLAEAIDTHLYDRLPQQPDAVLHSETPGMIVDRMSIMSLKLFHTRIEAHRPEAAPAHREKNLTRLALLEEQRTDLALCFDGLFADIASGRRRFKLYRQMKMYNDPELNPVLYRRHGG